MPDLTSCCRVHGGYCPRCDVLVGLVGLHVTGVERTEVGLRVVVESGQPTVVGCPSCGVVAHAHGRQTVELIDAPCFAAPVRLWWRKPRVHRPGSGPLGLLAIWLGHSDPSHTYWYVQAVPELLALAAHRIDTTITTE